MGSNLFVLTSSGVVLIVLGLVLVLDPMRGSGSVDAVSAAGLRGHPVLVGAMLLTGAAVMGLLAWRHRRPA